VASLIVRLPLKLSVYSLVLKAFLADVVTPAVAGLKRQRFWRAMFANQVNHVPLLNRAAFVIPLAVQYFRSPLHLCTL